jgi:sugar phosphate isomerase/epimerase
MTDSLCFTTDAFGSTGYPEENLRLIAGAGFSHVHWCHHWNDGFFYTEPEIDDIARLLGELNLKFLDCHGSTSQEKCWFSARESERLAGVELVKNRVEFTKKLGGDCVVMHIGKDDENRDSRHGALAKSIKELEGFCRDRNIRLALENMPTEGGKQFIDYESNLLPVIEAWSSEYIGFCLDVGHHNILDDRKDLIRKNELRNRLAERLIAIHIHDNSGEADNHWLPFQGSVDWENLAGFLRLAKYQKPLNLEVNFASSGRVNKERYTRDAYEAITRLKMMVG